MTPLPSDRSECAFPDAKTAYLPAQASLEANRCLYCHDAPCITACPTGIDIPEFIRRIATGNLRGSARTIFESNILGMSCARVCPVEVLCAGACVFHHQDSPPIAIGRLQRYATDAAYAAGWSFFEPGPPSGKSVGLIGAGPASLAAAHRLRVLGHACTLYEKNSLAGGLNTHGVAPHKMKADRALTEVSWVLSIGGIELKCGVAVPEDLSWAELEDRHDALFIGVGLGNDRSLEIPGRELGGVELAGEFIARLKGGRIDLFGATRATVIGGGNTAIDAVRELLGLGIPDVTLAYRGSEEQMSGYAHEWAAAKEAGAKAQWRTQPLAFLPGPDGRLGAIHCQLLDEKKRAIPGQEFQIETQLAIFAIGQEGVDQLIEGFEGVDGHHGCVVVDELGRTTRPGVYSGGDCANGGKEVVNAVAEGNAAAEAMDAWLRKGGRDA